MTTTTRTLARAAVVAVVLVVVGISLVASRPPEPEPVNLAKEVSRIRERTADFAREPGRRVAVFTGSSTIRLWRNLDKYFPGVQTVNTGFGGSTMSHLLEYREVLITRFDPDVVVIHEGDNDLAVGLSPDAILASTRTLMRDIRRARPDTEIVLVSAKPSPARWRYHDQYRELNAGYARLATRSPHISFVDVWGRMLDVNGVPRAELFQSDGLHLNDQGYEVWRQDLLGQVSGTD